MTTFKTEEMKINIAKIEAISLEETIAVTIDLEGELYNFRAVVYDSLEFKYLIELHYLDKYDKPLKNSQKKLIRNWLSEYFKSEGR